MHLPIWFQRPLQSVTLTLQEIQKKSEKNSEVQISSLPLIKPEPTNLKHSTLNRSRFVKHHCSMNKDVQNHKYHRHLKFLIATHFRKCF